MSFLNAEWRKLVMVNYKISPELLSNYIPQGTELDSFEGEYFISLVGFMFQNTRILGVKIPFHVNFEEVNLRFYVKRIEGNEVRRGVVFIKEIVPKSMITLVANSIYNENYCTRKMDHEHIFSNEGLKIRYSWVEKSGEQSFSVIADSKGSSLAKGSFEEFIAEHYWGYAKVDESKTNEYEVTHPSWQVYPVNDYFINVNFREVYGKEFQFLERLEPRSVFLAEGSVITVERMQRIN